MVNRHSSPVVVSERYFASPARVRRLLDDLGEGNLDAGTLYLQPWDGGETGRFTLEDQIREVLRTVHDSETGAAIFRNDGKVWIVLPPFPIEENRITDGIDASDLEEVFERDVTVGVVLLRMGRYAIGVVRGDKLLASKTDTRHVKNRHRAGGSSQRRFMRSRDRLIRELYDEACSVTRRIFEPHRDNIDFVLAGGERQTINGFLKRCDFLEKSDLPVMKRLLAVERPSHKALEGIHREVWKSRVLMFDRAE